MKDFGDVLLGALSILLLVGSVAFILWALYQV